MTSLPICRDVTFYATLCPPRIYILYGVSDERLGSFSTKIVLMTSLPVFMTLHFRAWLTLIKIVIIRVGPNFEFFTKNWIIFLVIEFVLNKHLIFDCIPSMALMVSLALYDQRVSFITLFILLATDILHCNTKPQ